MDDYENNHPLMSYFYPSPEKANSYFSDPNLLNQIINAASSSPGMNALNSIPSMLSQGAKRFMNPTMEDIAFTRSQLVPPEMQQMTSSNFANSRNFRNSSAFRVDENGNFINPFKDKLVYDSKLEMNIPFDTIKWNLSNYRALLSNAIKDYSRIPEEDQKYFTKSHQQRVNRLKEGIDHYTDLFNQYNGTF